MVVASGDEAVVESALKVARTVLQGGEGMGGGTMGEEEVSLGGERPEHLVPPPSPLPSSTEASTYPPD